MKNITKEVIVPYPVETVWQAFTKLELMSEWLMKTDFQPKAGHSFRFEGEANKMWRGWVDCKVTKIEPLKLIQFTWQNSENHTPTLVTYTFTKSGNGTLIHATNEGFDDTYGAFSGLFFRTMIKAGMGVEFNKKLPKVLEKI